MAKTKKNPQSVRMLLSMALLLLVLAGALLARKTQEAQQPVTLDAIPAYSGTAYVEINGNVPFFTEEDWTTDAFETYSELDALGRCGTAYANICMELMPTEPRGRIGSVKPSGWHTIRYNGVVEGNYLYNRCHLIGYQLAGENANPKNLITGTRYLNTVGMLPFENEVNDYVDETDNHVLYRVTPMYDGEDLVASGVLMEAYSVEDNGALVFCVYCYNVQPGVEIDYATGDSWLSGEAPVQSAQTDGGAEEAPPEETEPEEAADDAETGDGAQTVYVSASGTKYHRADCRYTSEASQALSRTEAEKKGYTPCGTCKP